MIRFRPNTSVQLCVLLILLVHCPPNNKVSEQKYQSNFITDSRNKPLIMYPDAGMFLAGNFNTQLNISLDIKDWINW